MNHGTHGSHGKETGRPPAKTDMVPADETAQISRGRRSASGNRESQPISPTRMECLPWFPCVPWFNVFASPPLRHGPFPSFRRTSRCPRTVKPRSLSRASQPWRVPIVAVSSSRPCFSSWAVSRANLAWLPISPLAWYHVPYSAGGVRRVIRKTWDEMSVDVKDCLTGIFADIDAQVVSRGMQRAIEPILRGKDQLCHLGNLLRGEIEGRSHMSTGDDKGVAR